MSLPFRYPLAVVVALTAPTSARAEPPEPALAPASAPALEERANGVPGPPEPTGCLPWGLQSTLEALGASTGVPDGIGASWYPSLPVRGQAAQMGLSNYQLGFTLPVYATAADGLFLDAATRVLDVRSDAILPSDRVRFPATLWDAQFGGGYVRQMSGGWSWGATLNLGSVSDRPFHSLAEATLASLVFLRVPRGERDGWLFYVVSTTNGQLGRNIPVPGLAYEFSADRLHAVVGFPFVSVDYRPVRAVQLELYYAAITDLQTRVSYYPTDATRVFCGFEWFNQSWFRAGRPVLRDQLFWYEKRLEGGVGWAAHRRLDLRLAGGYAFDRFFVENAGLSFRGRNRVNLSPGPFVSLQCELKY